MSSIETRVTAVEDEITKIYKHLLMIADLINKQSDSTEVLCQGMSKVTEILEGRVGK